MSQVFISPTNLKGSRFSLKGEEAHHLIRVLRKKPHDKVDLFDGKGGRFIGCLTRVNLEESSAEGDILQTLPLEPEQKGHPGPWILNEEGRAQRL